VDLEQFLAKGGLKSLHRSAGGYVALCPAHADRRPSLSINRGEDGRILLHCWAGCPTSAVLAAAGLSWSDLFPARRKAGGARYGGRRS
jgi:hypothetical protein